MKVVKILLTCMEIAAREQLHHRDTQMRKIFEHLIGLVWSDDKVESGMYYIHKELALNSPCTTTTVHCVGHFVFLAA